MSERVGVLALQGDFADHVAVLERLGADSAEVRTREEIESVTAMVIPGGESTTILRLLDRFELSDLVRKRIQEGMPVLGTCAGAIVLAAEVSDGEAPLGELDVAVRRNAYGRQAESFETDIPIDELGTQPLRAIFIRAPVFTRIGPGVEVLGSFAGRPVMVRQDRLLATAFHPELSGDDRVHGYFLERVLGGG